MRTLQKIAPVLAQIIEVLHWVGVGVLLVTLILSFCAPGWMMGIEKDGPRQNDTLSVTFYAPALEGEMEVYGLRMDLRTEEGKLNLPAARIFSVAGTLTLALMAMVFRNIRLCIETAQGKTSFAQGATPFQKDIVRMVREMGIFYLLVAVIGMIATVVAGVTLGFDTVESSVDISNVFTGIVMLLLSGAFEQGQAMQQEFEGLV